MPMKKDRLVILIKLVIKIQARKEHLYQVEVIKQIHKASGLTGQIGRALAMMGIGIDTSIASANEVQDAIAKQEKNPASKKADAPVENIMDKAIGYIKSSTDKRQAFDSIMAKYADQLTEKQVAGIKKFVR